MIFQCELISSNFAMTHIDDLDNPKLMTRLFPGMTLETATHALRLYREKKLGRPSRETIEVPDEFCTSQSK
jgi:hypothetical protein